MKPPSSSYVSNSKKGGNKLKKNNNTAQQYHGGTIGLIIMLFTPLRDLEIKYINKQGLFALFIARVITIVGILFTVYLLSFLFLFIISMAVKMFLPEQYALNTENWLSIPLVVGLPLLLRALVNFKNRDYLFCERAINLLQTLHYSDRQVSYFRVVFEIMLFVLFNIAYSGLLILVLTNFLDTDFIHNLMNKTALSISITISIIVYITIRILLMDESTPHASYLKSKRTFYLWLIATLLIIVFLFLDLINSKNLIPIKFFYAGVAILIAIDRTKNSYKALNQQLKKYLNPDDDSSN